MLKTKFTINLTFLLLLISGCQREENYITNSSFGLFSYSSYPIGTAIDYNELESNPIYKSISLKDFNSITPENIFKAESLHPKPLTFNWTEADSLVSFFLTYNKRIHGHTLIWHNQLP